jgi:hypothetical protein
MEPNLVPNATLQGMECQPSSGAKRRVSLLQDLKADHAFNPAAAGAADDAG